MGTVHLEVQGETLRRTQEEQFRLLFFGHVGIFSFPFVLGLRASGLRVGRGVGYRLNCSVQ